MPGFLPTGSKARRAAILFSHTTVLALGCTASAQTGFVNWETPHVSPLALTPSGSVLLAVNTADNRLEVFDLVSGNPVWRRSVPVGLDPVSVRARTESEVWVVNHISDSISVIDLPTGRVVRTLPTGDEPTDVVFAGAPQRAFVSVSQLNQVRIFDPANLAAAPTILPIQGEEPRALAVSADGGRVYVGFFESGNGTGAVLQQNVSNVNGPYGGQNPPPNSGPAFSPARNVSNPPAPPVAQIVRRNAAGQWMDDNNRNWSQFVTWNVLDHDVAIIDTQTLGVTYANSLMTNVMALGVKPDGTVTAVGTESRNEIRFEPNVQGIFVRVEMGSFNPATPSSTSITDLNPHLTYTARSIPQTQRELSLGDPRGIVWHPTSGQGYVTGMGSGTVAVIASTGARVAQVEVGNGPTGLALGAGGSLLYVLNKFDGTISTISTASNTEVSRRSFYDPTPSAIKLGRPFLYDTHTSSGLGQASCASCHLDGRSDFLAWDLGNPAGEMKDFNQNCRTPACRDWHPMKGPMVTQSLQGIVGVEPLHWRGDRENLAAFAPAYVGLQGADVEPSPSDMQLFTDFIATLQYPPSPNRNIDGTFPASVPVSDGGNGNPAAGRNLYLTLGVLPGGLTCNGCHALPLGTTRQIDDPMLPLAPQPLKIAQLRALWEKTGWNRNSASNTKSFGFNHQSEFDTLNALLQAGFNFGPPQQAVQRRRDVEAFMLCFDTETHSGIGQQVTFDGANNGDAALIARFNQFVTIAEGGQVGLVCKGVQGGTDRGWVYAGGGTFLSDLAGQTINATTLRTSAAAGSELTFTLVPMAEEIRVGIDRDADGYFDRDETVAGSNPADPASTPLNVCRADWNHDTMVTSQDFFDFITAFFAGAADFNSDGLTNSQDFFDFITQFFGGC